MEMELDLLKIAVSILVAEEECCKGEDVQLEEDSGGISIQLDQPTVPTLFPDG